jgi:hypothetical protein
MDLKMLIENKLIDSMPVSFKKLGEPGYLEGLKKMLEEKHSALLQSATSKAVYYVDTVPSSMNPKK